MARLRTIQSIVSPWGLAVGLSLAIGALLIASALIRVSLSIDGLGILLFKGGLEYVLSPEDAVLREWLVEEGDVLQPHQLIAILQSRQSPFGTLEIKAEKEAVLAEIINYPGAKLASGDTLALLSANADKRSDLEVIGFVSSLVGKKIKEGMPVLIYPSISDDYHDGALMGTVRRVGKLPVSKSAINSLIKIPELAKYIRNSIDAEPFLVVITPIKNAEHPSGYKWKGPGPNFALDSGIISSFSVEYQQRSLLENNWPKLAKLLFGVE